MRDREPARRPRRERRQRAVGSTPRDPGKPDVPDKCPRVSPAGRAGGVATAHDTGAARRPLPGGATDGTVHAADAEIGAPCAGPRHGHRCLRGARLPQHLDGGHRTGGGRHQARPLSALRLEGGAVSHGRRGSGRPCAGRRPLPAAAERGSRGARARRDTPCAASGRRAPGRAPAAQRGVRVLSRQHPGPGPPHPARTHSRPVPRASRDAARPHGRGAGPLPHRARVGRRAATGGGGRRLLVR